MPVSGIFFYEEYSPRVNNSIRRRRIEYHADEVSISRTVRFHITFAKRKYHADEVGILPNG